MIKEEPPEIEEIPESPEFPEEDVPTITIKKTCGRKKKKVTFCDVVPNGVTENNTAGLLYILISEKKTTGY